MWWLRIFPFIQRVQGPGDAVPLRHLNLFDDGGNGSTGSRGLPADVEQGFVPGGFEQHGASREVERVRPRVAPDVHHAETVRACIELPA